MTSIKPSLLRSTLPSLRLTPHPRRRCLCAVSLTRPYSQPPSIPLIAKLSPPNSQIRSPATHHRSYATHSSPQTRTRASEISEELSQLYAETRDEFEIATESTEAHATYAAEDREATRAELAKLVGKWEGYLAEDGGESEETREELKRGAIGQRIRELSAAVEALNLKDFED